MPSLSQSLRRKLEAAVLQAREIAEAGALAALEQLGVSAADAPRHLSPADRELRNRLRAHARQLGDEHDARRGTQHIDRLVAECAYEHWHRMLFSRFLADNNLLMHSESVSVTLSECDDLAPSEGAATGWELAGRYASKMLPQIFRPDAPELALSLPPEHQ